MQPSALPATVVFGADGFIGRNLLAGVRRVNPACIGVGRHALDLAAPDTDPLDLQTRGITHAVIAAGISRIAACEREPARTRIVNVTGTVDLVRQLQRKGIRVVALSSDYVFDGTAGNYHDAASVSPVNEYGRQKAALEETLLRENGDGLLLVRLSKVFDLVPGSGTLLDEMAARLLAGEPVRAARDQFFCPTLIEDVVTGLMRLLVSGRTGIVHLCAPDRMSRLQLAVGVAAAFGCDPELVREISLRDLDEPFRRPLDTSMIASPIDGMPPAAFAGPDRTIAALRAAYGRKGSAAA
jgi:dTDP-4-dehydrorhamnose reductase